LSPFAANFRVCECSAIARSYPKQAAEKAELRLLRVCKQLQSRDRQGAESDGPFSAACQNVENPVKRTLVLFYGVVAYVIFFATFLYAFGFVGNILVPKSIDSAPETSVFMALTINAGLLAAFALQHSIMARQWFKRKLTRIVPEPAERATYVLVSSLALILLFWQWQPLGGTVWEIDSPVGRGIMYGGFALGWLIVLTSTFMINHFDLFGLRQVWLYFNRKPYTPLRFGTPFFYRYVRHPLYFGWLLAFWCTPVMTAAHLFFAVMTTAYILVAIQFEERDLVRQYGDSYRAYRSQVPMILPVGSRAKIERPEVSGTASI
jgi:methanethiol S-methyltransferase